MAETPQNERARRLGVELRAIRREQDLTITTAAKKVKRSLASLSRIENGQVHLPERDLMTLLTLYGIDDPLRRSRLFQLCREAESGWWEKYQDGRSSFETISFEASADKIYTYEQTVIPGLLQTHDYIEALFQASPVRRTASQIRRAIEIRMNRQMILCPPTRTPLHAVISEAALHHRVGDRPIMRAQLDHLLAASELDHITLQVLPFSKGAYAGLGSSFYMFDLSRLGDVRLVYVDLLKMSCIHDEESVRAYSVVFNHLRMAALSEVSSQGLIRQVAANLQATEELSDAQ